MILLYRSALLLAYMIAIGMSSASATVLGYAGPPVAHWVNIQFISRYRGWAYSGHRLWSTRDGGKSWTQLPDVPGRADIRKIVLITATRAWAWVDSTVYRTNDGGFHWTSFTELPGIKDGVEVDSVVPVSDEVIWAGGGKYSEWMKDVPDGPNSAIDADGARRFRILRSAALWKRIGSDWMLNPLPSGSGYRASVFPVSESSAVALTESRVFWTGDSGVTWAAGLFYSSCSDRSGVTNKDELTSLWLPKAGVGLLFPATGAVLRSTDQGKSWCFVARDTPWKKSGSTILHAVAANDVSYAQSSPPENALYESIDGGVRWRRVHSIRDAIVYSMSVADGKLFVMTSHGLFVGSFLSTGARRPGEGAR